MKFHPDHRPFFMLSFLLGACLLVPIAGFAQESAEKASFAGIKVCTKCHYDHGDAWAETVHARTFEALKPGMKADAKRKAGLDPAKDYTRSDQCLGCHVTGYGAPGGYEAGMPTEGKHTLASVSCESCHGAGSLFREEHGKAESQYKQDGKKAPRSLLVAAGQTFNYEQACARCHVNYEGSANPSAKAPFSPFTPKIDTRYLFDYQKAVRAIGKGKAIHTHYKLQGIFEGNPIPPERTEFQKSAVESSSE